MIHGIHRYPPMDRVIYGIPLAEALADEISRLDARAVYVLASGTLDRQTDVVETVRRVLGNRLHLALEVQPRNLAVHRSHQFVVQGKQVD